MHVLKHLFRCAPTLLAALAGLLFTGCAMMIDGMADSQIDQVIDTNEERQIRSDYKRLDRGEPLKYHRNADDLRKHAYQEELGQTWYWDGD